MKRIIATAICLLFALSLVGCCLHHQWSEPSCAQAQYCLVCGEESELVAEHNWLEAECSLSMRCSDCGLAQGEPLGHRVQNGVCLVCGERLYSELSDFERYGIICDLQPDALYSFTTGTANASGDSTVGEIRLGAFGPIEPDQTHPARTGYEWVYVIINAVFYDDNARSSGVGLMAVCEDYHNIDLRGCTEFTDADGMKVYSVMDDGEEKQLRYKRISNWSGWYKSDTGRRENLYTSLWEIERPTGYDGVVVGLYSSHIQWQQGQFLHQVYSQPDFYLFRLA